MIQLAFELGKTVDELECADQYWIDRMLLDREARAMARAPNETEYRRRIASVTMRITEVPKP